MGRANNKPLHTNLSLDDEIFGFKANGQDVNIPLSVLQQLFNKMSSGITNTFKLSNNVLEEGSFTVNSFDPQEITTLTFNNNSLEGQNFVDFFTMLSHNTNDVMLILKESGFETKAVFKIGVVNFSLLDQTSFAVSLHKSLNRGNFSLNKFYTISFDVENDVFTETQSTRLKDLVYENTVQSISVSPSSFEKGVSTNLTFNWRVTKNDDTLNTVTVDGNDRLSEATGINRTYVVANQLNSKTVSLVTNFTRNNTIGGSGTITNNATSTAIIPQYYGLVGANGTPPLTYALLNPNDTTKIKKFLSGSSVKTVILGTDLPIPNNEKVFFLSTNSNAVIRDANGFNATSAFEKTTVTMELANGTQSITQYLLITPVSSAGTYTITTS